MTISRPFFWNDVIFIDMKIIINENQSFVLRRLSYVDEIMTTKFESIYSNKMLEYNCDHYRDKFMFFDVVFETSILNNFQYIVKILPFFWYTMVFDK